MKRLLLWLTVMAVMPLLNAVRAQCDVSNLVVSNVRPTPANSGGHIGVNYTMDLQFTVQENNGNKYTWIHLWLEADYQYNTWHTIQNAPYPCPRTNNAAKKAPVKAGTSAEAILGASILTFGFDIQLVSATGFATDGIMQSYVYDATVAVNFQGATIRKVPHGDGKTYDVFVKDVTFFKANYTVSDYLAVRAFDWATNTNTAAGTPVQCYSCENKPFVIGDPRITGSVNCNYPRTYNIFIDSRFAISTTPGVDLLYGSYQLYVDLNRNGVIDGIDFQVKNSTPFITALTGVPSGFESRYLELNGTFDYVFEYGDTSSSKNIIALVSVDNPEYIGADVTGILTNTCSVLPVTISNFTAGRSGNEIILRWTAATESNLKAYEVERKIGKGNYELIQVVPVRSADGSLDLVQYMYKDRIYTNESIYYRLRMVDVAGKMTYSDIRSVRMGGTGKVLIYPNPGRDAIQVILPADAGVMDLALEDMTGKTIRKWNGVTQQQMQLLQLQPGMYVLRIHFRNSGEQVLERLIVQ